MPVPKGTKANVRKFAETSHSDLMRCIRLHTGTKGMRSQTEGNRTVWTDYDGNVVAKRYVHRKSMQCLVAAHVAQEYLKETKSDKAA